MRTIVSACALCLASTCTLCLTSSGCAPPPHPAAGVGGALGCPSTGILLLDWTVHGRPAGTASCTGVAKLTLYLTSQLCGDVEIDPIPCALDRFRYDELPLGPAEVVLQGVDVHGALQVSGSAALDLTPTVPAKPTPVTLD